MKYLEHSKHLPMVLFAIYVLKLAIFKANLADALTVAAVAALIGYMQYDKDSKEIKKLREEMADLSQKVEDNVKLVAEVRTYVSSDKLGRARASTIPGRI